MIVISDSIVLSPASVAQAAGSNQPRIGWHNLLTAANVFASEAATGFPVTNLANPATYLYWQGQGITLQNVGISLASAETVNYVGIARHNFGSTGASYVVESSNDFDTWTPLTTAAVPANDFALINEFDDTTASYFRVNLTPGSEPPEIGVLFIGRILRLQRRIYVGHTPFVFGRDSTVSSGFSEEGQFLGRVVRRRMYQSAVSMSNLTPAWYRSELDPFFHAAVETPFFWAWRPGTYPNEVGFAWLTGDGSVSNQLPNGFMQTEFRFQGIR